MEGLSSFTELNGEDVQITGSAWQNWLLAATSSLLPVPLSGRFSGLVLKDSSSKPEMQLQEKEKGESNGGIEWSPAKYTL